MRVIIPSLLYGRVDLTKIKRLYPMSQWDKKYYEKLKKGYEDITYLYSIVNKTDVINKEFISKDLQVKKLIKELRRFANKTVSSNYKVSSDNVTQKMINEAQIIIDNISNIYKRKKYKIQEINNELLRLFKIIPRKMSNVNYYLISEDDDKKIIGKLIDNEQSILDTLASQVMNKLSEVENKKKGKINILENMGIKVIHVNDAKVISEVKQLMGNSSSKFSKLFKITNIKTNKQYQFN